VRICPVEGEGALSKTERLRKALEIIAQEGANSKDRFRQVEAESCPITFREQSEAWLASVATRKRKPVKPHTLRSWRSHLAWLNPRIGEAPLASINNLALRNHLTPNREVVQAKRQGNQGLESDALSVHCRAWRNTFPCQSQPCYCALREAKTRPAQEKTNGCTVWTKGLLGKEKRLLARSIPN